VCVCVRRCVGALHLTSTQRNIIADKKPTQKYRKSVSQRFGKKKAAQKSNRKVLKVSVSCVSRGERERSGGGTT
jgi:3-deoxy-D-manno-octulosonic-acid transferase